MNALTQLHPPVDTRSAIRAAAIMRLAKELADWAERPRDDWSELRAIDAACRVWPDADDLVRVRNDLMFELRLDPEGYPLTDEGDRDWNADRRFFPMGVSHG